MRMVNCASNLNNYYFAGYYIIVYLKVKLTIPASRSCDLTLHYFNDVRLRDMCNKHVLVFIRT